MQTISTARIIKGQSIKIVPSNPGVGRVYFVKPGQEKIQQGSLVAGTDVILGPYYDDVDLEIVMSTGSATVEFLGQGAVVGVPIQIKLTQAEYDALPVKNLSTLYLISG